MAISRRAAEPKGGRPTRRIARSCAEETSGMSDKSIPGRRIGRPLLAARPARADDADALAIASPPRGIGHAEHAASRRSAQSQESRLLLGVTQIRAIEGIRIAENGPGLLEGDPMLGPVNRAFRASRSNTVQYIRKPVEAPSDLYPANGATGLGRAGC